MTDPRQDPAAPRAGRGEAASVRPCQTLGAGSRPQAVSQSQMSSKPPDVRELIERLKAADGTLRATAALRIALRALAWYAKESNWREDDWGMPESVIEPPGYGKGGQKARNAIKRIERQLDPEWSPSPVADLGGEDV